jgi:hypothetical protein
MDHVYEDINFITGNERRISTHEIPAALMAIKPYLRKRIKDARFWDGKFDTTHTGEVIIQPMDSAAKEIFWKEIEDKNLLNTISPEKIIRIIKNKPQDKGETDGTTEMS